MPLKGERVEWLRCVISTRKVEKLCRGQLHPYGQWLPLEQFYLLSEKHTHRAGSSRRAYCRKCEHFYRQSYRLAGTRGNPRSIKTTHVAISENIIAVFIELRKAIGLIKLAEVCGMSIAAYYKIINRQNFRVNRKYVARAILELDRIRRE